MLSPSKVVLAAVVFSAACVSAHAQCRYGSQCGRTIYEESARQREHDQYISMQTRRNGAASNYTTSTYRSNGNSSAASGSTGWGPSLNNYKQMRDWSDGGTSGTAAVRRSTPQDYFEKVKRETANNVAGAKDKLALAYYWADGTPENKPEAFRLWKELAATDAEAEMTAAGMLYVGDGIPKDEEQGLRLARSAAARGNTGAIKFISGVNDTSESVETASRQGDYVPMLRLGWGLLYGRNGYGKDEAKGLAYIKRAAETGNAQAETFLGFAYMFGDGTVSDDVEATKWFLKAAAHKQNVAAYQLAWLYVASTRPNGPDVAAARKWSDIVLARNPNDAQSIFQRGSIELSAKDEAKARAFFLQAGELGDMKALGQAAIMEWRGDGSPADWDAGYKHMLASANAGETVSMYEMGTGYQSGKYGLATDPPRATQYFQKAAENGLGQAQQNLAMAYYRGGRGVAQDYVKAAGWALKAAESGRAGSAYMLAVLYQEGTGVPKDATKALFWMQRAANDGDPGAKAELAAGFTGN